MTLNEFEHYRAVQAVNFSTLKYMDLSPLHYLHATQTVIEDTPRLGLGRAVHTATLEPDMFPLSYVVYSGKARRGKEWEAFKAANADKTIVKRDEYALALACRDAIRTHPKAGPIVRAGGHIERGITWTDKATGLACKGRPDIDARMIWDVKSCATVDKRLFGKVAARMGYFRQLAFYRAGIKANGGGVKGCGIIAVEIKPPHDVAVFVADEGSLEVSDEKNAALLARVAECRASGQWPGRYPDEEELSLPAWEFSDEDQELTASVVADEEEAA